MARRDHATEMATLERRFTAGRKRAFLDAIYVCVCSSPEKAVPSWAKAALARAMYDIAMAKAASWDDVLGEPHKGRKIAQIRKQRAVQWDVFRRVNELRSQKPKQRDPLQIVADEFKIERPTAKRYFEHVRKMWFSKAPTF